MKERPILFSGPMVRALLDGTKTQTRRLYKVRKHPDAGCEMAASELMREPQHVIDRICPYGQPGDRLWVRETFWADATTKKFKWYVNDVFTPDRKLDHCRLIPGIHMPRRTSRILLEITGVRAERLQDISEADAIAEGLDRFKLGGNMYWRDYSLSDEDAQCSPMREDPIESYRTLWEQINGPGSWDSNPWVWVIEFKRLAG